MYTTCQISPQAIQAASDLWGLDVQLPAEAMPLVTAYLEEFTAMMDTHVWSESIDGVPLAIGLGGLR